jgi:amylosucrase
VSQPPTIDDGACDDGAFADRVARWRPDLLSALARVFPDPEAVADRLLAIARTAYDARPAELRDLDARRLAAPDWFQRPATPASAATTCPGSASPTCT